jgi:hypothetical protein
MTASLSKVTGCLSPTCSRCGTALAGRGKVRRSGSNQTGQVEVVWRWQCACGRVRTLKQQETIR